MSTQIIKPDELRSLLDSIQLAGTHFERWNFQWEVQNMPAGWLIRLKFCRPDVDTMLGGFGLGRHWYVESGSSEQSIIFTAWLALRQLVEHELHESFTVFVDGKRVRLLDPHKSLRAIAYGSRTV